MMHDVSRTKSTHYNTNASVRNIARIQPMNPKVFKSHFAGCIDIAIQETDHLDNVDILLETHVLEGEKNSDGGEEYAVR